MTNTTQPERAAPDITNTTPENQAATYRNHHQVWPVRAIACGSAVRPLPAHVISLEDLTFQAGDLRLGVKDYMARRRTAGLLILKDGAVALERYGMGNVAESLWTSFAVTHSVTGTLVGAALHDRAIASLDDACDLYAPLLRGSAYDGVTIRNLLRMCSGVAWREDDTANGRSDTHRLARAMLRRQPAGAVLDLMCTPPRAHPQGVVFNYSTGESCVLAGVIAAATGRSLADYCGERIWRSAGMEADGHWQTECEGGLELGGFGLSARLRDVGRFGLLMLEDGEAFSGQRTLPRGWRDLARLPDCEATGFGRLSPGNPGGYGYHWWTRPPEPGVHDGLFSANGAHGRILYINPGERVVAAIQSAWRQPDDTAASLETVALLRAAVRALRPDPAP